MTAYGADDNNAFFSNAYSNVNGNIGDHAYGDTGAASGGGGGGGGAPNAHGTAQEERLRDIKIREQRAIELERELDEREAKMRKTYRNYRPPKNWPFAKFAFARHDIDKDIASRFQNHVRKFYSLWWLVVISTLMNWLSIIWYAGYEQKTNFMSYVLLPTLYVGVGCPCSWMFWYKRYYKAMQIGGNLSYMFFIFFGMYLYSVLYCYYYCCESGL